MVGAAVGSIVTATSAVVGALVSVEGHACGRIEGIEVVAETLQEPSRPPFAKT